MNSLTSRHGFGRRAGLATSATLAAALTSMSFAATAAPAQEGGLVEVIVRATDGALEQARTAAISLGGVIERDLGIINGFSADVPASSIASLQQDAAVVSVSPDVQVRLQQLATTEPVLITDAEILPVYGTEPILEPVLLDPMVKPLPIEPVLELLPIGKGDLGLVAEAIRADKLHEKGITGQGIDIALIDSGVVPVGGLDSNNISFGPDLSFEADYAPVTNLDTFGHGTHMAGIMVASGEAQGIAPGARVVSVKVADATGATDVSQVIAGIDWVVQNKNTDGRNIRVLNLSFGTDAKQDYTLDPLAYAAEVAWHNGIVTVVSAGNHGDSLGRLANPAVSPWVIAVGATDTMGTATTADDTTPSWSAVGNRSRVADVAAPGRSIESLRSPGSFIDSTNPTAQLGVTLFKGSGTSQAAAVTSAAVALLLEARPELTPDQVKYVLRESAATIANNDTSRIGKGAIDVQGAVGFKVHHKHSVQKHENSDGSGSLHDARGTSIVVKDGVALTGEMTANGSTWAGSTWAGSTWAGSNWQGSTWAGSTWAGSTWAGSTWAGSTWAGSTWAGSTWAGSTWAGSTWASTAFWAGLRWN